MLLCPGRLCWLLKPSCVSTQPQKLACFLHFVPVTRYVSLDYDFYNIIYYAFLLSFPHMLPFSVLLPLTVDPCYFDCYSYLRLDILSAQLGLRRNNLTFARLHPSHFSWRYNGLYAIPCINSPTICLAHQLKPVLIYFLLSITLHFTHRNEEQSQLSCIRRMISTPLSGIFFARFKSGWNKYLSNPDFMNQLNPRHHMGGGLLCKGLCRLFSNFHIVLEPLRPVHLARPSSYIYSSHTSILRFFSLTLLRCHSVPCCHDRPRCHLIHTCTCSLVANIRCLVDTYYVWAEGEESRGLQYSHLDCGQSEEHRYVHELSAYMSSFRTEYTSRVGIEF
jgi:hypothetical protein